MNNILIKRNLQFLLTVLLTGDPCTAALCSLAGKGQCRGQGTRWVCALCRHTAENTQMCVKHTFPLWCVFLLTYRLNDGVLDLPLVVLLHPGLPDHHGSSLPGRLWGESIWDQLEREEQRCAGARRCLLEALQWSQAERPAAPVLCNLTPGLKRWFKHRLYLKPWLWTKVQQVPFQLSGYT